MMTKNDFLALADAIRPFYLDPQDGGAKWDSETPEALLRALVLFCKDRNPQFKAQRWMAGLQEVKN